MGDHGRTLKIWVEGRKKFDEEGILDVILLKILCVDEDEVGRVSVNGWKMEIETTVAKYLE